MLTNQNYTDMDQAIRKLSDTIEEFDGIISKDYLDVMRSVVDEWNQYLEPAVEAAIDKMNQLEDMIIELDATVDRLEESQ